MNIKLYATGPAFPTEGISIAEAMQILNDFTATYTCCVELATKLTIKNEAAPPTLRLKSIASGSLDTILSLDFPSVYATLAPLLPAYATELVGTKSWEIFFKLFKLVAAATEIFKKLGKPATFSFENCTEVNLNINYGNGTISAPKFMKKILSKTQSSINDIAEMLHNKKVKSMAISTDIAKSDVDDFDNELNLLEENYDDYTTHETEEIDNNAVDILCRPYSINKNTSRGRLDFYDGARWVQTVNFTIEEGNINDYIDAMKENAVTITARKKFLLNSLGERKITHLFLCGVQLP